MSEMVDRVAKAIADKLGFYMSASMSERAARAAIAAMREPTKEMIYASEHYVDQDDWRAMIDTALQETVDE